MRVFDRSTKLRGFGKAFLLLLGLPWPADAAVAPTLESLSPSSGTGAAQTFRFVIADPDGAADLRGVQMLFGASLDAPYACHVVYVANTNQVYLRDSVTKVWLGPQTPGTGALDSGKCRIDLAGFATSRDTTRLTISYTVTFLAPMYGAMSIFAGANDAAGLWSDWHALGSWTAGLAAPPPVPVSVTPGSGSAMEADLRLQFSAPGGAGSLRGVQVLINDAFTGARACHIAYWPQTDQLFLHDDLGQGWYTPARPTVPLSNSQCSVTAATVKAAVSGTDYTLNLPLGFSSTFTGQKSIFAYIEDAAGNGKEWKLLGSWNVTAGSRPPAFYSYYRETGPAVASGVSQRFGLTFRDQDGGSTIDSVQFLFTDVIGSARACRVTYWAKSGILSLRNDANNGNLGNLKIGTGATIANSYCAIDNATARATVASGSPYLTLEANVSFASAFSGGKTVYVYAQDETGLALPWQEIGYWTVDSNPRGPAASSSVVVAGSGTAQTIQLQYSDPDGANTLQTVDGVVGANPNGDPWFSNPCRFKYEPSTGRLYLRDARNLFWIGPQQLGSGGLLGNGLCQVNTADATAQSSGPLLTLRLPFTFSGYFANTLGGSKTVYGSARDADGNQSPWTYLEGIAVSTNSNTPSVASVTPSSGTGRIQRFAVTYNDPNGDFDTVRLNVNANLTQFTGCPVHISIVSNRVYLQQEGNGLVSGVPGAAARLENASCYVDLSTLHVTRNGTSLTVEYPIEFKPAFAGAKSLYTWVQDFQANQAVWRSDGLWLVP